VVSLREKLQNYDQADELFKALEQRVDPRVLYDQRGVMHPWAVSTTNCSLLVHCEIHRES
jgi:hypothetical protein